MKVRLFLVGALMLAVTPLGGGQRLAMKLAGTVAFAPADLVVQTTVPADEDNRAIEIVAESSDFYRSSEVPLEGKSAPRTTLFRFRSLPGGEYDVRAILKGPGGRQLASVQSHFNVVAAWDR